MTQSMFEVFKIVLGIIVAGFFLYFMLQFAGLYATTETKSAEIQEYKNLKKLVEDTYIYNIPTNFDLKKPPLLSAPPFISEGSGISVNPSILFFFQPEKRLVVYRGSLDYGFWNMYFVGALPELRVLYSLGEYELDHYSLLNNLTDLFPHSIDPQIDFGLCDGDVELVSKSRDDFLRGIKGIIKSKQPEVLKRDGKELVLCTADFQKPKTKVIITKLKDLPIPENGFVVKMPVSGKIGSVSFKGKDKDGRLSDYKLVYKDALDIFSVIVGGVEAYKFKNKLTFENLLAFSKEEARRANVLATTLSDPNLKKQACVPIYTKLRTKIDGEFKTFLESVLKLENYNNPAEMERFLKLMEEISSIYDELKTKSCE